MTDPENQCGQHESRRTSKRIIAHQSHASEEATVFSYSLESRRHWPNHAKVRSMRQRNATGAKPFFARGLGGGVQVASEPLAGSGFGLALVALVGGKALDGGMAFHRLDHDGTRLGRVGLVGGTDPHGQERTLAVDGHVAPCGP